MPKKERQEECEDGNQQMDHCSGPRVAKSKTTGRRRVRMEQPAKIGPSLRAEGGLPQK